MEEYISRDELLAKQYESEGTCGLSTMVVDVRDIEDAPAADVVPVVRCRDCTHWGHDHDEGRWCWCGSLDIGTAPDFYCKDGDRMDKEATP